MPLLRRLGRVERATLLLALACALPVSAQTPAAASTPDSLYRAGYEAYNRGDLPTAHARFARLVVLAPRVAVAHAAYGEVLLAQGDAAAALVQLELAQQLDPHTPATRIAIARALLALNQPARAVPALADAVAAGASLTPDESRDYAAAAAATSQPDQAIAILKTALAPSAAPLSPDQSAMLEDALGSLLAQQGSFSQAAAHFTAAIAASPTLAGAHAHLGSALLAQQQAEAAIPELQRAAALAPANPAYALELGRALSAARQDAEAVRILQQAVTLADAAAPKPRPAAPVRPGSAAHTGKAPAAPGDPTLPQQARYTLALALQAAGDPQQALPLFAAYTAVHPQDTAALTNYALALVQTGDAKHAVTLYGQALAHGPDNPTLREDLGVAYLQQSDLDHAIEQFHAGLALTPDNPHLHYDLGLAYKLKDNLPAAIPEFEHAEALDPTLPDPPYTLGVIRMQQGDFPAAAAQLEQAVALRPGNGAAWAVLGNVYKENGELPRAINALRKAIALQPEQPSTHISLAAILAQQGDREAATAERRQAADLSRVAVSRQRASFALRSGRALLEQGNLRDAEAQLRTAVEADPQDPSAHQSLAETLTREGRPADAALERKQADAALARKQSRP